MYPRGQLRVAEDKKMPVPVLKLTTTFARKILAQRMKASSIWQRNLIIATPSIRLRGTADKTKTRETQACMMVNTG